MRERNARVCPKCGGESKVYDVRIFTDGQLHRKRVCLSCGVKWRTVEIIEKINI